MEKLKFITAEGVCGYIEEWDPEESSWDAGSWLDDFGALIGKGTAPLPNGGYIDLSRFAVVVPE